jgi:hypothetical protein
MYRYVTVLESHEVKSSQIMSYRGATAGVHRAPHCSSKKAPGRHLINCISRGRRSDASDTPSLKLHSFVPSGNVVSPSRLTPSHPCPREWQWGKAGFEVTGVGSHMVLTKLGSS